MATREKTETLAELMRRCMGVVAKPAAPVRGVNYLEARKQTQKERQHAR